MKHPKKEKDKDKDKEKNKEKEKFELESKKAEKINQDDNYLSYNVLKEILKDCQIPKKIIEERNSELFYETLTGKGSLIFINNMQYQGSMKNGLLESGPNNEPCQIIFADGTKYEGEIHQNKITGKGKYIFPSGSTYEGTLLNGLRHGTGKFVSPEGITYEGEWKNGLKDGKGIMKRDTMTYDGDWKEGRINGKGRIRWANGNLFDGHFKLNHIEGDGYMVWYDLLEKYIGKWKDDKQNGFGINIWYEPKGEMKEMRNRYVGEWEEGIKQGYGIFFYSNGAIYEGEWKNNMKHGFGVMIFEDGKKYVGRFEEDRIIDKDNQLNFEEVKKLMKDYELNKINNQKIMEENKDKINNINDIYKIVQMKNASKDLNESNISIKKKETKKGTKSIKALSKSSNNVNSKEISRNPTMKEISVIAEEDNNNNVKNASLKGINNPSVPTNEKNINNNNKENKKENINNTSKITSNNNTFINNPMNKTGKISLKTSKLGNLDKSIKKPKNLLGINLNSKVPIFLPYFDLSDLILEDPSISQDLIDISKVILRNLSVLKLIYRYLNRLKNSKLINEETNSSKMIYRSDSKQLEHNTSEFNNASANKSRSRSHSRKKSSYLNKSTNKKLKQMNNPPAYTISAIKLSKIEDNIRSDEISFCISMLDVWDYLRDKGILNEKVSICQFDRIFSLGNNTLYENFMLPEDLTNPEEIYKYMYNKMSESKKNFIYKYKNYLKYYYRDSKIPKKMRPESKKISKEENTQKNNNDINIENNKENNKDNKDEFILEKIHDNRRIILPRLFQESLIRAALLLFSYSNDVDELNMKLSKKLQKLLAILFPQGLKKKNNTSLKSSHSSRVEQSFNTSVAVIDSKSKIQEYSLRKEFMSLFQETLKNLFNKFHSITNINKPKLGDKTILYSEFYYRIVLYKFEDGKDNLIRKLVQNKFAFIDLITNYFKEKTNLNSEENRKDCTKLYDYFHSLFNREMIEFEFNELIFLLAKKYVTIKYLKGTYNEYKEVVDAVEEIINKLEKPKNVRKKYVYPTLQSHIIKQKLIDEERRRQEEERRRKLERQRYLRERELMDKEENINAFNDKSEDEEEESAEDLEEELF